MQTRLEVGQSAWLPNGGWREFLGIQQINNLNNEMNHACFRADTNQQQQAEIHGSQQAI